MNNLNVIEQIENANDAQIDKLFWIAASSESQNLESFLEDLSDNDWKECFPELFESDSFEEYKSDRELISLLLDFNKLGFIAEVTFPIAYNFTYEGETVTGWSIKQGHRSIRYIYAESTEELLNKIIIAGEESLQYDKEYDKKKNSKQLEISEL